MHQVCVQSYAVGCVEKYCMTVIMETHSYRALTAPSMTCMTSCTYIALVYLITNLLLLSHISLIGKQQLNTFAVLQSDLDYTIFAWCIRPLHMQRWIIMSHNLVTKNQNKLTPSKFGTQIAFQWDMMSKMTICLSVPLLMLDPSACLHPNLIPIWWLAEEAPCRGNSLRAKQASRSA